VWSGIEELGVCGSGVPRPEFSHVDEIATTCTRAMVHLIEMYQTRTKSMLLHVDSTDGAGEMTRQLSEPVSNGYADAYERVRHQGLCREVLIRQKASLQNASSYLLAKLDTSRIAAWMGRYSSLAT
jgi:hypothetical protein